MSGIFKQGFDGYDEEIAAEEQRAKEGGREPFPFRLNVDESKEIIILDDAGTRFYEHSFFNQMTKKSLNFTSREGSGEPDFLIEDCGRKPNLITVMTVKDMSGYLDRQSGQRKGVGDCKPFKLKRTAAKMISVLRKDVANMKAKEQWANHNDRCVQAGLNSVEDVANAILKKGNVLKGVRVRVGRFGAKSESSGDNFTFLEFVNPQVFGPNDKVIDYETVYAVKPEDEIKRQLMEFYNGQPPFRIPGYYEPSQASNNGYQQNQPPQQNYHKSSQQYNNSQPPQQNYQSHNYQTSAQNYSANHVEAPTYTADDIPF